MTMHMRMPMPLMDRNEWVSNAYRRYTHAIAVHSVELRSTRARAVKSLKLMDPDEIAQETSYAADES